MSIKTILFDFDGTLIDTNDLIYESFMHTFEQYGYSFTKEEILQFNGPPLQKTFSTIDPQLAEEMIRTYRAHNNEHHDEYVSLFPNVRETLDVLKDEGFKLAIVSAKMRDGVNQGLKATNIGNYFDTIISIDNVSNPKPHPESVYKALDNLYAKPEEAIMIGDNYHDIEAGNNAGTKTAGVAWSTKGVAYLQRYNPTYMLNDMTDLLKIIGV